MNLRKSTKKALIAEVKRLRKIEEEAIVMARELGRRDKAMAMYRKGEEEIIKWSLMMALGVKDFNDYWDEQDPHDTFWAERYADVIERYAHFMDKASKEIWMGRIKEHETETAEKPDNA